MKNVSIKTLTISGLLGLFAVLSTGSLPAQRVHRTTLRVGQEKSLRAGARLQKYNVVSDELSRMVVHAWFDVRAQRLRLRGKNLGTAKIIFSGTSYYVSAGIPKNGSRRRSPMSAKSFKDTIYVTVRAARKRPVRGGSRGNRGTRGTRRTRKTPKRPNTRPNAPRLPKINRSYSKTLGKGRRGSISLQKLFGGPPAKLHAMSASHSGVVSARISNGRLMVKGLNRGSTMLYIRGKIRTSRGLQDVFVKFRIAVR